MKKTKLITILLALSIFISGCSVQKEQAVPVSAVPVQDSIISIYALGDNLLHMPVVNSGKKSDGTYEYSHLYENLQPNIEQADLAIIGQETIFGGAQSGYSGYPMFNSPSDMGKTLVNEGFDVVLHGSNHVIDKGTKGIENTIKFWKNYPETIVLGINESQQQKDTVKIVEEKGARIALLNYTYGTNGMVLPSDKSYMVNYIDEEKICTDALYAQENADFTIAFMHWGTEYATKPDSSQIELANKMCEWGVDLIIGSHPHVIQPVEWIYSENGNKMLVYYSLGNYVSRQINAINLLGGVADVKLRFDGESVTIDQYKFVPIITHYDVTCTKFAVYPLSQYTDELASVHGVARFDGAVSVKRWTDMLVKIFNGYDTQLLDYKTAE